MDDLFGFGGYLFLVHFNIGYIFDDAAYALFFINVKDDDVKQAVILADVFAVNILFQIQRGGKEVGEVYKVPQVGAAEVVVIVYFTVFFVVPEGIAELVVVFDDAQFGIGYDNRRRYAANQGICLALRLMLHM